MQVNIEQWIFLGKGELAEKSAYILKNIHSDTVLFVVVSDGGKRTKTSRYYLIEKKSGEEEEEKKFVGFFSVEFLFWCSELSKKKQNFPLNIFFGRVERKVHL